MTVVCIVVVIFVRFVKRIVNSEFVLLLQCQCKIQLLVVIQLHLIDLVNCILQQHLQQQGNCDLFFNQKASCCIDSPHPILKCITLFLLRITQAPHWLSIVRMLYFDVTVTSMSIALSSVKTTFKCIFRLTICFAMGSMPYGLTGLLKEGYKLYSGISEVVQKNIEACKELSQITKTSIGPNGCFVGFVRTQIHRFVRYEQDSDKSFG